MFNYDIGYWIRNNQFRAYGMIRYDQTENLIEILLESVHPLRKYDSWTL